MLPDKKISNSGQYFLTQSLAGKKTFLPCFFMAVEPFGNLPPGGVRPPCRGFRRGFAFPLLYVMDGMRAIFLLSSNAVFV